MDLSVFQRRIDAIYGPRDRARGIDGTFRWLVEEVGELARALRTGDRRAVEEEVGDVLAWTVSLASLAGVDAARAAHRYADGCPKCGGVPCRCPPERPGGDSHDSRGPSTNSPGASPAPASTNSPGASPAPASTAG